jgi:hypothetical protein
MNTLGDHIGLESMFCGMGWGDFPNLYDRTYEEPTLEFLSTFATDNESKVLTFQLQG